MKSPGGWRADQPARVRRGPGACRVHEQVGRRRAGQDQGGIPHAILTRRAALLGQGKREPGNRQRGHCASAGSRRRDVNIARQRASLAGVTGPRGRRRRGREELVGELPAARELDRRRLAVLPGPDPAQDLGRYRDGLPVLVKNGIAPLEHGDQQRHARGLDREDDADVAARAAGSASSQLHQPVRPCLVAQFAVDLSRDGGEPLPALGDRKLLPGKLVVVLRGGGDEPGDGVLGNRRRMSGLQHLRPAAEGVDIDLQSAAGLGQPPPVPVQSGKEAAQFSRLRRL